MRGLDEPAIGEAAARIPVVLHELSPQAASLEEASEELTDEAVEYQGEATTAAARRWVTMRTARP